MTGIKGAIRACFLVLLCMEARAVLRKYDPKVVAITGTVGKTSTKDAIYSVLRQARHVRKSEKGYANDIGVPLAILGAHNPRRNILKWLKVFFNAVLLLLFRRPYPAWLVLEVGADRPGDIKRVSAWLSPHIVVVTRFADVPAHIEYFSSREELIEEKANLVRALRESGLLIVNKDDPDSYGMRKFFSGQSVSFGFGEGAAVQADYCLPFYNAQTERPEGVSFKVAYDNYTITVKLYGSLGYSRAYAALPALVVGTANNISVADVVLSLEKHTALPGRMKILEGVKQTTIIDDSYNSSPIAATNALDALAELRCLGRKIVVLGDMLELGKMSAEEHKRIGRRVAEFAHMLVTVGVRARGIAEGALNNGMNEKNITQFDTAKEAGKHVELALMPGDVVLVKGSQALRMEYAVEEIMAHPELKEELLVRQEPEWLKKQ